MIFTMLGGQLGRDRRVASGGGGSGSSITWNSADKGALVTLSGSDKIATKTSASAWQSVRATVSKSSGKWYFEVKCNNRGGATDGVMVGIATAAASLTNHIALSTTGFAYYGTGQKYTNNTPTAYGASYTTGDVVGVYADLTAGTLGFLRNNADQGIAFTGLSGTFFPACSVFVGASSQTECIPSIYAPPSGYSDWA